jgi:hypothetical protein
MPAARALSHEQLQEAAILVVACKRAGKATAEIVAVLCSRFGVSPSTAKRLCRRADFAALVEAATARELDVLPAAAETAQVERELVEQARGVERPGVPEAREQGRILSPDPLEPRPVAAGFEITDPRKARERAGLSAMPDESVLDAEGRERDMLRDANYGPAGQARPYRMSVHEAAIAVYTQNGGYSTADLLTLAVSSE